VLVKEGKTMAEKGPCWEGYEMVGMKTKNGRKVPNCVPKTKKMKYGKMVKAYTGTAVKQRTETTKRIFNETRTSYCY
jgi:thiaminase